MIEVKNLDNKRVCDISGDGMLITIRLRDCLTVIRAREDGTLKCINRRIKKQIEKEISA